MALTYTVQCERSWFIASMTDFMTTASIVLYKDFYGFYSAWNLVNTDKCIYIASHLNHAHVFKDLEFGIGVILSLSFFWLLCFIFWAETLVHQTFFASGSTQSSKVNFFFLLNQTLTLLPRQRIKNNRTDPRDMVDLLIGGIFVAFLLVSNNHCVEVWVDKFQVTMKKNSTAKQECFITWLEREMLL